MNNVRKEQLKRRIQFGLRHFCGPKAMEDSNKLRDLPSGAKVLVYRTTSKLWDGPHLFFREDGETSGVQTKSGRKIFRSQCVKPWTNSSTNDRNWNTDTDTYQKPIPIRLIPQLCYRNKTKISQHLRTLQLHQHH